MLNDLPTLEDKLGRVDLVKKISLSLANCTPPVVVGVHGDWGAGKTSFLKQMQHHLDGGGGSELVGSLRKGLYENKVATVWFDAWRYQYEPVPVVALLHAIRDRLSLFQKTLTQGKKLTEVTARSLLSGITDITNIIKVEGLAKSIQETGEKWEKERLADKLNADNVRTHLEAAISELLGKKGKKLVVFIDDLDRCNGEMATKLLDSLKVYLDLNNCVFVLGLNQQAVQDAIAGKLGDGCSKKANAYLEKICQNVWRLPLIGSPGHAVCQWVSDEFLARNLSEVFKQYDEQDKQLLPPNPRKLKGFANLINRNSDVGRGLFERSALNSDILEEQNMLRLKMWVVALYFYQFFPDLFVKWRYSPGFFDDLRQWILGEKEVGKDFDDIILTHSYSTDLTRPVPAYMASNNYPDPSSPQVLWVSVLIADIPSYIRGESFSDILRSVR